MSGDEPLHGSPDAFVWPEVDTTVANEARVYDFLLGGTDHFEVDRLTAEAHGRAVGGIDNARHAVEANRRFLGRVVRHLAGEAGIRQFLDLGTGIPNRQNVHEVAQEMAGEARVVYVDKDPVVFAHAHMLLASGDEGATDYVGSDLRDVNHVLDRAAVTLDLAEPVAVLFVSMLHFLDDEEEPHRLVRRYLEPLAPGSCLVVSHMATDIQPEAIAALVESTAGDGAVGYRFHPRSRTQVALFFDGLELVDPGVVSVEEWRPDGPPPTPPPGGGPPPFHAGVGRKR